MDWEKAWEIDISSLSTLDNLTFLSIPIYYGDNEINNHFILSGFPKLKTLIIGDMYKDLKYLKKLPSLEKLKITSPKNLDYGENAFPKLNSLEF